LAASTTASSFQTAQTRRVGRRTENDNARRGVFAQKRIDQMGKARRRPTLHAMRRAQVNAN
jgi:hypothetical protein